MQLHINIALVDCEVILTDLQGHFFGFLLVTAGPVLYTKIILYKSSVWIVFLEIWTSYKFHAQKQNFMQRRPKWTFLVLVLKI